MRKYCLAFLVVVLAGYGGSLSGREDATPNFSSSAEIQAALNKAGLGCTAYQTVSQADREWGAQSAADVGKCDLENENIKMTIWKDKGQKDNWIDMAKKFGCDMAKASGVSSYDFVDGGLWTVSDTSQTLAKKISDAVGGKPVHIDCGQGQS